MGTGPRGPASLLPIPALVAAQRAAAGRWAGWRRRGVGAHRRAAAGPWRVRRVAAHPPLRPLQRRAAPAVLPWCPLVGQGLQHPGGLPALPVRVGGVQAGCRAWLRRPDLSHLNRCYVCMPRTCDPACGTRHLRACGGRGAAPVQHSARKTRGWEDAAAVWAAAVLPCYEPTGLAGAWAGVWSGPGCNWMRLVLLRWPHQRSSWPPIWGGTDSFSGHPTQQAGYLVCPEHPHTKGKR